MTKLLLAKLLGRLQKLISSARAPNGFLITGLDGGGRNKNYSLTDNKIGFGLFGHGKETPSYKLAILV